MTDNAAAAPVRPKPPRMIRFAEVAIGVQVLLTIVTALLLRGYTSSLTQLLIKANRDLSDTDKNKRPVDTYLAGSARLMKDLNEYRYGVLLRAVIVGVLIALAAYGIWRGLGMARWLYIVAAAYFSLFGILALGADGPKLPNTLSFVVALSVVAAIVLLLLPESARFFATVKALRVPAGRSGAPRPTGLRGIFGPAPSGERPRPIRSSAARKPAETRPVMRPAGAAANAGTTAEAEVESAGRGKPKARSGAPGTDAADAPAGGPAPSARPRGRGKSRRV